MPDVNRVDVHVGADVVGTRSLMATGPQGETAFTYTLIGDQRFLPVGQIAKDGQIRVESLANLSTWGSWTPGLPFGMLYAGPGDLRYLTRETNPGFGIPKGGQLLYWQRQNGVLKVEGFGEQAVWEGTPAALALGPGGEPFALACERENKDQLCLWTRSREGGWSMVNPPELKGFAGDFALVVSRDGTLMVLACTSGDGPYCVARDPDGSWKRRALQTGRQGRFVAACLDASGQPLVTFAVGKDLNSLSELHLAVLRDGGWTNRALVTAPAGRHIGRTAIACAAGRTAVAWESLADRANRGAVMLTLTGADGKPATHEVAAQDAAAPSLALAADGRTAYVGYSSGPRGTAFSLAAVALAGGPAPALKAPADLKTDLHFTACRNEMTCGYPRLATRGFELAAKLKSPRAQDEFGAAGLQVAGSDPSPAVRGAAVKMLGELRLRELPAATAKVLQDADPAVPLSALAYLDVIGPTPEALALLRRGFEFRNPVVNTDAARGVAAIANTAVGEASDAFLKLLNEALTHTNAVVRIRTAVHLAANKALLKPGTACTAAVEPAGRRLLDDLKKRDTPLARSARQALERLAHSPPFNTLLTAAVQGEALALRAFVAEVFSRVNWPQDPALLSPVFRGGDVPAQLAAIAALNRSRPAGVAGALGEALTVCADPRPRIAAVFALRSQCGMYPTRTNQPPTTRTAALPELAKGLADKDPEVLYRVVDALGAFAYAPATEAVRPLVRHTDPKVRRAAIRALGTLGDPVRLAAGQRQLFVDDFLVARLEGAVRSVRPPTKHPSNPLITATEPWEKSHWNAYGAAVYAYGTVLFDPEEGLYKFWYRLNRIAPSYALYATSRDGLTWDRPVLNLVDCDGSKANNIVFQGNWFMDIFTVFRDPREKDPAKKYRLLYFDLCTDPERFGVRTGDQMNATDPRFDRIIGSTAISGLYGLQMATSPDGIHWEAPTREAMVPAGTDEPRQGSGVGDVTNASMDEDLGLFRVYTKIMGGRPARHLAYLETSDYQYWTEPEIVLHAAETGGPDPRDQFYGMTVTPYEGMYLGFLWIYHESLGTMEVELATSRDGVKWEHCSDRTPLIRCDQPYKTQWDGGMACTPDRFLVVGDEIRLYYSGFQGNHSHGPFGAIGLATCKLDRFAAIRPRQGKGSLTTKPMLSEGRDLRVNLRTTRGSLRVEALDAGGAVLPGYAAADCEPLTGDALAAPVRWKGKAFLPGPADPPFALRFLLDGEVDLYSFHLVQERSPAR